MSRIHRRNCDYCGNYYEGRGVHYCSRFCSGRAHQVSLSGRFWSKVDIGDLLQCWNWKAGCKKNIHGDSLAYGHFHRTNGISRRAHRTAWQLVYGAIPQGLSVLHKCDNPSCCNPTHLFLGTQQDNIRDMVLKNRQLRGESKPTSKLTEQRVKAIRQLANNGVLHGELAQKFGVSYTTITSIVKGEIWQHV